MSDALLKPDDLSDFNRRVVSLEGATKPVYVAGEGPAVIVMTEMPGISPHVARFARWVRAAGFRVYMPSLFGTDGDVPDAETAAGVLKRACVSAEFRALGGGASSPISNWLRALARLAHGESGGPGVGAIGMCFTGNFALNMMLDQAVLAPVVSQPSLPLDNPGGIESSADELSQIRSRLEREDLSVLAYRFAGDSFCRAERFAAYQAALGDRFIGRVLPDTAANTGPRPPFFAQFVKTPHSVVTVDLVDEAGQPTLAARDEIIAFFRKRLKSESA
ncbi:dienelactone hydrolase family protein [Bradyrhizobium daqingense]|uniref:Dienelactone hydrolase n=1 Tax=Bradyrhizobium daqingense TaxID=993502 RepID=A0A562LT93_9BRAD|nr:dienelactone hydrolase family protein [Bradyrhizobium daqingense]TWI10855.1 dienelactone hydrolase [Bradyrhizobium daqingense]UFS85895.1 dienelactone hydrolase family protein [Bradyrhizobium daqingense]